MDLGASVNLLPNSVYVELGLGELEPTNITLQLANRSVTVPRGIVKGCISASRQVLLSYGLCCS